MKKLKYWGYRDKNVGELDFCCADGENLFHNISELKEFSNERDFFPLEDDSQ
ncbi:MAG: hypothetical protein ACTSR8_04050 [Promethearchaeota archaeon]